MAFHGARRVRRAVRALAAGVWECLVSFGSLQAAGGFGQDDGARPLSEPPPGHPERLRPDVPMTALERALLKELDPAD
ncbi:hypothetical protein MTQ10_22005 [Streptomyces sp. XM83C]|jgi:hypothetical protein|uniref:DUF6059 family protein n=1 Tax=Streptomyces thermocoprophilus TaxID=78356 RepID=A0ABV5VI02_9ACTN|nr:DUF6059 family protein [Streptomyces sp. XM83C]MCK1822208.1 hypothetical protein [Streptomyces sp. XM83C]